MGAIRKLEAGVFANGAGASPAMRAYTHGFTWLRDLRALGTDAARTRARALVSEFMSSAIWIRWPIVPTYQAPGSRHGLAIMIFLLHPRMTISVSV